MTTYRIRDWDEHFECAASRKLLHLVWVAIPNKMDGGGYMTLVNHPNGAAHLGAWYAMVEIASRQKIRGTLPDVGGICQCLGKISQLPGGIFEEVLPRLLDIGWVEPYQQDTESATMLAENPNKVAEKRRYSTEQNRTERTEENGTELGAAVERLYRKHPKKKDLVLVPEALRKAVARGNKLCEIEACHAAHVETAQWKQDGGRFCPSLARWLEDDGFTQWPEGKRPAKPLDPSKYIEPDYERKDVI